MIKKNNNWAELSSLWQEEKGVDAVVLAKSVKRKTWSMRFMVALEGTFGIIGAGFGVWVMIRNQYSFDVGLGLFVFLFATVGTFGTLWARKGAWVASSSGVGGQLRLTLKRAESGVKLANLNLWAIIPGALMISGVFISRWDAIMAAGPDKTLEISLIFIIGVGALIGTGVWAIWYKTRKLSEIKRLKGLLADLESEK